MTENGNAADNIADAATEHDMSIADTAKKLKRLKKKLRTIESLERKLQDGTIVSAEPEQSEKVQTKSQVQADIEKLEKQFVTS